MRKPMRFLPFVGWVPDLPLSSLGTVADIRNALPLSIDERTGATVYGPVPSPTDIVNVPLPRRPVGCIGFVRDNGDQVNLVGTEDNIYQLTTNTGWDDGLDVPAGTTVPTGLAYKENGELVLVDNNPDGFYVYSDGAWGALVPSPAAATNVTGVAVKSNGDILIADTATNRIYTYSSEVWDSGFAIPVAARAARSLAVAPNGDIVFADDVNTGGKFYTYSSGSWDSGVDFPDGAGFVRGVAARRNGDIAIIAIQSSDSGRYIYTYSYETATWDTGLPVLSTATNIQGLAVTHTDDFAIVDTNTDKIYVYTAPGWRSVLPAVIQNTLDNIDVWEFDLFGENVVAAAALHPPLILKADATQFALLGGDPPNAGSVAEVSGFAVAGDIEGHPNRVQWSGLDALETWGVSVAEMSDFQDLLGDGGRVQRVVPGERGLIFQERAIQRLEFTGDVTVFRIDNILPGMGTRAPRSVCWQGKDVFFYGLNGFYRMNIDTAELIPIGAGRVDQWFLNNSNISRIDAVVGAVDFVREIVWWAIPGDGYSGYFSTLLCYHFGIDRWSKVEIDNTFIGTLNLGALSLDQLHDSPDFPLATGIDTPGAPSLDDSKYYGTRGFAVFRYDSVTREYYASLLGGEAMNATISTGEISDPNGGRLRTTRLRPVVEGGDSRISVRARDKDSEPMRTVINSIALNSIGEATFRVDRRYQGFQVDIFGEFDKAYGVRANPIPAGAR